MNNKSALLGVVTLFFVGRLIHAADGNPFGGELTPSHLMPLFESSDWVKERLPSRQSQVFLSKPLPGRPSQPRLRPLLPKPSSAESILPELTFHPASVIDDCPDLQAEGNLIQLPREVIIQALRPKRSGILLPVWAIEEATARADRKRVTRAASHQNADK